jgi:hypothetical protein
MDKVIKTSENLLPSTTQNRQSNLTPEIPEILARMELQNSKKFNFMTTSSKNMGVHENFIEKRDFAISNSSEFD